LSTDIAFPKDISGPNCQTAPEQYRSMALKEFPLPSGGARPGTFPTIF